MNPVDPSQTQQTAPAVDTSQSGGSTAPVSAGGNGDNSVASPNNPTTQSPVTTTAADTGLPGGTGVTPPPDLSTPEGYAAAKAALLKPRASAPVPEPAPEPPPAPEPQRLPNLNVRPRNDAEQQQLVQFRQYQREGGNLDLIGWASQQAAARNPAPSPAAPPPPEPGQEPGTTTTALPPTSSSAILARLEAIKGEIAEAGASFNLTGIARLVAEQSDLTVGLTQALRTESEQMTVAQARQEQEAIEFEARVDSEVATAAKFYGADVNRTNSPLNIAANQVLQEARDAGNPAAGMPEFVHAMYAQAAARIGYVPQGNGNVAPPPRPAQQSVSTPVPPGTPSSVVAVGDQRATTATRTGTPVIRTMADYHAAKAQLAAQSGRR